MKRVLLVTLAILAQAGCAMIPVPASAKAVPFDVTSAPSLRLYPPRFDGWDGHLDLRGVAYRTVGLPLPAQTHVDIVFRGRTGAALRAEMVPLYLPSVRSRTGVDMAKYRLHVGTLPRGTTRIDIRADDGSHRAS
jgi:hypothetical protein